MREKAVSGILLILLLFGILTLHFNIQPVKSDYTWTTPIIIRDDGYIYPDTAPISTADCITYTLTDNIVGNVPDYISAIIIYRDNIVVDGAGYTLQGTGAWESKGIDLSNRVNVTIKNVEIEAFKFGIYLSFSSDNHIHMNKITRSTVGIWLRNSLNNVISGNYIKLSTQPIPEDVHTGVEIYSSSNNNTLSGNCIENTFDGISLDGSSDNNIISGNNVKNNYYGITALDSANYNNVSENTITSGNYGIQFSRCSNNTLSENNITENHGGIILYPQALNNVLYENHIANNNRGITLWEASYNSIYSNNFINNNQQVYIITSGHANLWDNGYPSGGNYWSDYAGVDVKSGPNQDQPASDGIGDTAYVINADNRDYYPLMNPYAEVRSHITILSPQIKTYAATSIPLTFTVNETASWMGYSLDAQANVTITGNTTLTSLSEGLHNVVVYANSTAGTMWASYTVHFTVDLTPPTISVLSPENTTYTSAAVPLTFIASEPTSWMGYSLDNEANVTIYGNTTLTVPTDGSHNVIVYVNDTAGNTGASNKVSFTMAVPPVISILSPENASYAVNDLPLTFIVDEPTDWISYSLDGQANVTITGNTTLTSLAEGPHGIVVYANDTTGHMGSSTIYFTIDTTPPIVSVLSPENTTYVVDVAGVPLTFTLSESTSWMGYSLDNEANVTISGNSTLTIMTEGLHSITVYANDTAGNWGASTVFFTVERLPCSVDIAEAVTVFPGYRLFETNEVFPEWTLPVNVTVNNEGTLPLAGTVNGYYSLDNATWLSMGPSQPISLGPSDGTLLTFYWNLRATEAGKSVYFMKFNATTTSENFTSTDEVLVKIKVRLMGDSDGDNDCDVGDQRKTALATFELTPDPLYLLWNSFPIFTDMDGDGDVDVGDQRKQQIHMFESW